MARSHLAVLTLVVLFLGHYLLPLGWMLWSRQVDGFNGRYYEYQCVIIIMILFLFITLNTLRLALMWESVQRVMKLFLHLPLGVALGRMNARVSRWFFEAPETEGTRFDLIHREADTLARLCEGNRRVRDESPPRLEGQRRGADRAKSPRIGGRASLPGQVVRRALGRAPGKAQVDQRDLGFRNSRDDHADCAGVLAASLDRRGVFPDVGASSEAGRRAGRKGVRPLADRRGGDRPGNACPGRARHESG